MLQNFQSENNLAVINSNQSANTYISISYDQHIYRVNIHQHQSYNSVLLFWSVFCITLSFMCIGGIVEDMIQKNGIIVCSLVLMGGLILLVFNIFKRRYLGKIFIISSANFVGLLISWLILLGLKYKTISATSFFIILEFVLSLCYMRNKSILFGKIFILGQIFFFSLKIDNIIKSEWILTLFLMIIFAFILLVASLFVGIFTLVNYYVTENIPSHKKCGFAFIGFICFCLGINCFIPFFKLIFGIQFWICSLIGLVLNILMIIFIYNYQLGIKIFFCRTQQIKTFNQNELKKFKFQQISQNWYNKTKLNKKQRKKLKNEFPITQSIKNIGENSCLVCLQNVPQVIWIPCGHLTVCIQCCQKMFDKKNACCILCKLLPTQIYIIQNKGKNFKFEKKQGQQQTKQEVIGKKSITFQQSVDKREAESEIKIQDTEVFNIKHGYKIQVC